MDPHIRFGADPFSPSEGRVKLLENGHKEPMAGILWTIISVLFIVWLLGFLLHFGGGLIHLILVAVVVLVVINLLTGRGATT